MFRIISPLFALLALSSAAGLAFVAPAGAEELGDPAKAGVHDHKHPDPKNVGGKGVEGKRLDGKGVANKGSGNKGLPGGLGRVDDAISTGILGLAVGGAVINAITNAPPANPPSQ